MIASRKQRRKINYRMQKFLLFFLISGSLTAMAQNGHIGGFNVYYGSIHNHCDISDGEGSVADAYRVAKMTSDYDFFGLSDHAEMMTSSEWNSMKSNANVNNEDGVFITFRGFEWSSPIYGHVTVVGSNNYSSSISLSTNNFEKLINWVNSRECVAFFNHPGDYNNYGPEFNHFDVASSDKFVGMELWNDNIKFDRYYYNNGYFADDNGLSYYDEALQRGWRIGAAGNEDNHTGNWGIRESKMAILAGDLTRNSIWEAMKSRRFYSTLDRNMEISFKIQGQEMGSILHPGVYTGEIRLHDPDKELFTKVEILRNGILVQTIDINEINSKIQFSINASHADYYYIRVHQLDGDMAISSPIFFNDQYPVNSLPVVNIVSPLNGSVISPGMINIESNALDDNGSIRKVAFYLNDVYLGYDSAAPYSVNYNFVSGGINSVSALAFDDNNAVTWSEPSVFTVSGATGIPVSSTETAISIIIQHYNTRQYLMLEGINKPENMIIADITGRIVSRLQIKPEECITISSDDLHRGIYLLFIANHPEVRAHKFVIE
jgi:hypothetical protein